MITGSQIIDKIVKPFLMLLLVVSYLGAVLTNLSMFVTRQDSEQQYEDCNGV